MGEFTIIGDPALNRTLFFVQAVQSAGFEAKVLPYGQALSASFERDQALKNRLVKIESPGRDFATEVAFLKRGARCGVETQYSSIPYGDLDVLQRDPGRIFASRQWYLGWRDFLSEIETAGEKFRTRFLNHPAEIAVMFDKAACYQHLAKAGIPVPATVASPSCFDALKSSLEKAGWSRVFLKPCHGSGGSGVVALAIRGSQIRATTAVELNTDGPDLRLYATRRLRTYHEPEAVRKLIDALCRERLHVEAWVPKAGANDRTFDVRVVVIGGQVKHLMLRLARGPITNLHLGAQKAGDDLLRGTCGEAAVALVRSVAEKAAACFPRSLIAGIDIAVTPDSRRAIVLEVNAFGDLLEGVAGQGADSYTEQVRAAVDSITSKQSLS